MRRLMLLALPFALLGCGSDNTTTGITLGSLVGVWNLQTAGGAALPFTLSDNAGGKMELLAAVETVQSTGIFTGIFVTRTTINSAARIDTLPSAGTLSLSGTLLSVSLNGSATVSGTLISSGSFSFTDPTTNAVFVFVKQ